MAKGKKRVLWLSDLVAPTGFARVSHSIIHYLKEIYDIVGLGVNYRGDPHDYNFPIYPASLGQGMVYGEDRLIQMLSGKEKFDILFILNDSWIVNRYLHFIKQNVKENLPKIVIYFPVDSTNHDKEWYQNFDIVNKAVTYTKFGHRVITDDGCMPELKLDIIPHGVSQDLFYKKFTNRVDAKTNLFKSKANSDKFIFLNANRNQPRKRLDYTMEAFRLFSDNKDDVLLYMHCGARDNHIDVPKLSVRYGIDNKMVLTNLNMGVQSVSDEQLNDIYNACDVGLNTGMGEGWGLTSIEHAMTGAPQIVPDHSACSEIFYDCGLLVNPKLKYTFDHTMTEGRLVDPVDVAARMELLYRDKDLYNKLAQASLEKFSKEEFSWKSISETWDSLFKEALKSDEYSLARRDT